MKNIALTFASASLEEYNLNIKDQIQKIREIENRLPNTTEFGISYLVVQHKKEVIDVHQDYHRVLKETFSAEFLNIYACVCLCPLSTRAHLCQRIYLLAKMVNICLISRKSRSSWSRG